MDSKLDVITYSALLAINSSESGWLHEYNMLHVFLLCIACGALGYVGGVCADPTGNAKLSLRKLMLSIFSALTIGLLFGILAAPIAGVYGLCIASLIAGLRGESFIAVNLKSLWKGIINSFVCITRREKMKDEDL